MVFLAPVMCIGGRKIREVQQLYMEMKREVFTRKSLFEAGDSEALQKHLKMWLGVDEKMKERKMNSVTHPR